MDNVFVLDREWLDEKRADIKNEIVYARYKAGDDWRGALIQSADVTAEGLVEASFTVEPPEGGAVTDVELYASNGKRIGSRKVNITGGETVGSVLYVFRFRLFQVVGNETKTGGYDALSEEE